MASFFAQSAILSELNILPAFFLNTMIPVSPRLVNSQSPVSRVAFGTSRASRTPLRTFEKDVVSAGDVGPVAGESYGASSHVISAMDASPINQRYVVYPLLFHIEYSLIASGSKNGRLDVYSTGSLIMSRYSVIPQARTARACNSVVFLADEMLASGGEDGCVALWDCTRLNSAGALKAGQFDMHESVTAMTVPRSVSNGHLFIAGMKSGVIQIFDIRTASDGFKSSNPSLGSITAISEGSNGGFIFGTSIGEIGSYDIRCMRRDPIIRFTCKSPPVVNTKESFSVPDIATDIWEIAMGNKKKAKKSKVEHVVHSYNGPAHKAGVLALGYQTPLLVTSLGLDSLIQTFDCVTGSLLKTHKLRYTPVSGSFSNTFGFIIGSRPTLEFFGPHAVNLPDFSPHRNAVTAVCAVGHTGIASGGSDGELYYTTFKKSNRC